MSTPRWALGALAASLLVVSTSWAQEAPHLGRRLSLVVGPVFVSQRDEKASPMRYSGAGPLLEVGYASRSDRRRLAFRLGGATGSLDSRLTQGEDLPRQETWRGWMEVEYARWISAADSRTRWFAGGLLAAHGSVVRHFYANPVGSDATYAFGSLTLSPLVGVRRATGGRSEVAARLGLGIVALIERPYSAVYRDWSGIPDWFRRRIATVNSFQAADFTAGYTARVGGGADLMFGYRLVVERYSDAQPFRIASHGLSFAVAFRVGGDR